MQRREFLTTSVAAMSAVAAGQMVFGTADSPQPIIDTHQHLWDLSKFRLPWLGAASSSPISRSFLPKDYEAATAGLNVVKTVYMEVDVAPEQQAAEADYVIDLCQRDDNPMAAAVISGQPGTPEFEPYVRKYAKSPYIKGLRRVLPKSTTTPGICLQDNFVRSIKLLGDLGLRYDLCLPAADLADAAKLVAQCPETSFILDHCGNMPVVSQDQELRQLWETSLKEMAAKPNVVCKISGIVASANEDWKPADLAPIVNFVIETFGEDRVMFASDWPVCTRRASFAQWVEGLKKIVKDRTPSFRQKLFHDNAMRVYALA